MVQHLEFFLLLFFIPFFPPTIIWSITLLLFLFIDCTSKKKNQPRFSSNSENSGIFLLSQLSLSRGPEVLLVAVSQIRFTMVTVRKPSRSWEAGSLPHICTQSHLWYPSTHTHTRAGRSKCDTHTPVHTDKWTSPMEPRAVLTSPNCCLWARIARNQCTEQRLLKWP